MYSIKQAQLITGALPLADVTIYYIDIRAFGKGYEEFYKQAEAMGIHFVKGRSPRSTRRPTATCGSVTRTSAGGARAR